MALEDLWIPALFVGVPMAAIAAGALWSHRAWTRALTILIALGLLAWVRTIDSSSAFWIIPILLAVVVLGCLALEALPPGRSRGLAIAAVLAALAAVNVAGDRLRDRGWRDIDGIVDCYPTCNRWHVLGAVLEAGPIIVGSALVVFAVALTARERFRRRPTAS